MRVLLLVNDLAHLFNLLNRLDRCLKPLYVRVLSQIHVCFADLNVGLRLLLDLLDFAQIIRQVSELSLNLLSLLLQQIDIERVDLVLEGLRGFEADLIFHHGLTLHALAAERVAVDTILDHLMRLEQMRLQRVELRRDPLQPIVEEHQVMQVCNEFLLGGVYHVMSLRIF